MISQKILFLPRFIAESVVAILAHAMEVGLVLPVVAVLELTILVEPDKKEELVGGF